MLGGLAVVVVVLISPCLLGIFFIVTSISREASRCQTPVLAGGGMPTGAVQLPLTGAYRVTSGFGVRVHPVTGQRKQHNGIDLSLSPHGGPVLAMAQGVVTTASPTGSAGNLVVIDHGLGLQSKYMHLARIDVSVGQQVPVGHPLGLEGATGRVTGPHLHWEVWIDGQASDPAAWARTQGLTLDGNADGRAVLPPAQQQQATAALQVAAAPALPVAPVPGLPDRIGVWGPEQIGNAADIVAAGKALGLDDWTITVGVMTAMGESSLRNLGSGDAAGPDSRGLFQQRANGAWGSLDDRMTPRIAATNFFRALVAVPGYHELAPTIAAHRTQRNRDPQHYAKHWPDAVLVVATLLADPTLLARLPASGLVSDCQTAPAVGDVPPGPGGECPATGMSGERGLRPSALRGFRCTAGAFPGVRTIYGVGGRPGPSDHPNGLAADFMIDNYRTPEGKALGWQLAEWTRANADSLQVKYIIWDMKYWSAAHPDRGWTPYTRYGPNPSDNLAHRNHVHVSYY